MMTNKDKEVKAGDKVRVHYTGKFEDGTVFDSSEVGSCLEFTVGEKEVIKGFEDGVLGMKRGETKTLFIEEAYGRRDERKIFEFERSRAPEGFDPSPGEQIDMNRADGKTVRVTVIGKNESAFIMDCNHPLAGKNLIFNVKLEEIL